MDYKTLFNTFEKEIRKGINPIIFPDPVAIEPPYQDFVYHKRFNSVIPEHYDRKRSKTRYLKVWPSVVKSAEPEIGEGFIRLFSQVKEPVSFEILGLQGNIILLFTASEADLSIVKDIVGSRYREAYCEEISDDPLYVFYRKVKGAKSDIEFRFLDYYSAAPYFLPIISLNKTNQESLDSLYTIFSDLHHDELCLYQVLFIPARYPWEKNIQDILTIRMHEIKEGRKIYQDHHSYLLAENKLRNIQDEFYEKMAGGQPLFAVSLRVAVFASSHRSEIFLKRLHNALSGLSYKKEHFRYLTRTDYHDRNILSKDHLYIFLNRVSLRSGMLLSSLELASLCHLPSIETLARWLKIERGSKTYPAPQYLSISGEQIGYNEHQGIRRDVMINEKLQNRHVFIVGKSGCGKSTLIQNMIKSHLDKGDGFGVIDPHGKLVREMILPLIPKERVEDVIYLNAGDFEYPIAFNVLAHSGGKSEKEHIRVDLLDFFEELLETKLGVTIEHLLNFSLTTLLRRPDSTLADIERLLIDKRFRQDVLSGIEDTRIMQFWEAEFPPLQRKGALLTITNKLSPLILPESTIRPMLVQNKNAINFLDIMNQKKIFLANLSFGAIGQRNSELLGRLLVSKIQISSMMREGIPSYPDWYLYIDEFQHMATPTMREILTGARKYKLHLTLATQGMGSIPDDLLHAVFNASTLIFFNCDLPKDQLFIEKVLGGRFTGEDVGRIKTGDALIKIESSVFNLATYPTIALRDRGFSDEIIKRSRGKYAVRIETIKETAPPVERPESIPKTRLVPPKEVIIKESERSGETKGEEGLLPEEARFLEFLSEHPGMFVTKIYKTLGLSGYKGDRIKEGLIEKGLITQEETRQGQGGRLAKVLVLTDEGKKYLKIKSLKGKGGNLHKNIQQMIKDQAELYGWKAKIEERLPGSLESVDVGLTKGDMRVAVEVSNTTKPQQEIPNIKKCLEAGYDYIICVLSEEKSLALLKTEVKKSFMIKERERIRFYQPSRIKTFLSGIDSDRVVSEKPAVSDIISNQKQLLNTKEASEFLGIRKSTLYEWVVQKKISYVKVGRLTKFRRENLEKWLKRRTQEEDRRGFI